jgi:hypothetical protein
MPGKGIGKTRIRNKQMLSGQMSIARTENEQNRTARMSPEQTMSGGRGNSKM